EGPANSTLYIVGRPEPSPGRAPEITRHYVGPDHFKTLGIAVLRGRTFTPNDRAGQPGVTIVNRTAALRFWPGQDPIGQRIWFGGGSAWNSRDSAATVIGVVADVPYGPPDITGLLPSFYTPYLQFTYAARTVLVRTSRDPAGIVADLRKAVDAAVPDLPIYDVRTMQERLDATWSKPRFRATLLGGLSLLALLFAATGVYGVIGQLVAQRTYEMGVRMAIGGESRQILGLVVGTAARLAGLGVVIGLAGAIGLARLIRGLLFETAPFDPVIFGAIALGLIAVALVASLVPASRATRVDPLIVLRSD
ncbi:MAG: FtsX-like permease family protein, partial [Gemmatimonadota bacterium]